MVLKHCLLVCALLFIGACGQSEQSQDAQQPVTQETQQPSANAAFDAAVEQMSAAFFEHVPEAATQLGVPAASFNESGRRMMDRSLNGNAARNAALASALSSLEAVSAADLSADRQRTHAVLTTMFEGMLGPAKIVDYGTTAGAWTAWYLPYAITQNSGPTIDIPNFLSSQQPVGNAVEAEDYLARLATVQAALDGALEAYKFGVQQGAVPPDFIVAKSLDVVEAFLAQSADQNVLYASFVEKLDKAGVAEPQQYSDKALQIVTDDVLPAYQRIADYLGEIKGSAPHDAGIWRLPNGEALYAAMIRHMTDVDASADDIHQTGLDEVARITTEMDRIFRSQGYNDGTVGERMLLINAESRFLYDNNAAGKQELLSDVRGYVERMQKVLPQLFTRLPEHKVEVRAVPEFSQDSAPIGYYNSPSPDGSRPGYYFINLRDTALHPSFTLATLSYHEASPGHHLDAATSIDRDVPMILKGLWSNTSGEGWALYAEQLAAEVGMYDDDPFGDLGRLQAELHRAVRLVVDTGMHAKRWSREQAIDYMVETEGLDRATSTSEIERYVVWPGQALGYKLGQLNILKLRAEARRELGDAFDLREFNQQVLDVASAPMPYIQQTVTAWIAQQRSQLAAAAES